eukprot:TRINITY_DN51734_c0_g1_i1.p1 TRINITY_DN51734_c0_g1~~TRINITY_DN51734_c0_g1_i1.p1  ORF type:complete len:127 (-),score=10.19 TRINITY_DN51734_c0_g1_i1:38-418(-)
MVAAREFIVEMLGVFFLCFVGGGAVYGANNGYGQSLINIAFAHGLIIFLMVCWGGPITGGQYNPAVTIPLILTGDLPAAKGIVYIGAQIVGSVFAGFMLMLALPNANKDNPAYATSPMLGSAVDRY